MHENCKLGIRTIQVGEIIAEQLGGIFGGDKTASIMMAKFARMVLKVTTAARKVIEGSGVGSLHYDYSRRKVDYDKTFRSDIYR